MSCAQTIICFFILSDGQVIVKEKILYVMFWVRFSKKMYFVAEKELRLNPDKNLEIIMKYCVKNVQKDILK